MPDAIGKLSEQEKTAIAAYLNSFNHPPPNCEICGTNSWLINDHVVSAVPYGTQMSPVAYPQFMIFCSKCRHVKYLSATNIPGVIFDPKLIPPGAIPPPSSPTAQATGVQNG
jgi:hypothetical protein